MFPKISSDIRPYEKRKPSQFLLLFPHEMHSDVTHITKTRNTMKIQEKILCFSVAFAF